NSADRNAGLDDHARLDLDPAFVRRGRLVLVAASQMSVLPLERLEQLWLGNPRPLRTFDRRGHRPRVLAEEALDEVLGRRVVAPVMTDLVELDLAQEIDPARVLQHGGPGAPLRVSREQEVGPGD